MEKEKKNNGGLIALIIVLFLLILGLGGYIVYDKVITGKDNNQDNNTSNDYVSCNCPEANCDDSVDYDKLAEISKMSYNFVNSAYNNKYSISVLSNGKVLVNFIENISNISDAKDLILFSGPGNGDIAYILTNDGNVYKYDLANSSNNNFDATKLDEYKNIKQMVRYMTRKAHAGGCDYVVLIDSENKYYSLDSYCV